MEKLINGHFSKELKRCAVMMSHCYGFVIPPHSLFNKILESLKNAFGHDQLEEQGLATHFNLAILRYGVDTLSKSEKCARFDVRDFFLPKKFFRQKDEQIVLEISRQISQRKNNFEKNPMEN